MPPRLLTRVQTRNYARHIPTPRPKGPPSAATPPKKQGRNAIFRPLPASQLADPVFAERADTLDLPVFRPKDLTARSVPEAMLFHPTNDAFNAYGLPRSLLLEFRLLSKPCSVVRHATLNMLNTLDIASRGDSKHSRIVCTGDPGCGKSFLLLQAVHYALSADWIVLYIPRAVSLLDSSTPYHYDVRTQTYHQPAFAQQLLRRLASVNARALQPIHTQDPVRLEKLRVFAIGTPLLEIIDTGVRDPSVATDVLAVVLEQLARQTQHPVLVAVDDFQALFCTSAYRAPDFNRIQSLHLAIPRLLLEYAGGRKSFARGAFVGAVAASNTNYAAPPVLRDALGLALAHARPYATRPAALAEYARGLRPFAVPPRLSVAEAAALFELWARGLALHTGATDEMFLAKYTEAGGNARHFVWRGLLATLES